MTGLQCQCDRNAKERRQPEGDEPVDEDDDDGHVRGHAEAAVECGHGHFGHGDAARKEAGPSKQNGHSVAGDERGEMDVLARGEKDEVEGREIAGHHEK